jgi:hypothetical protein
MGPPAVCRQLVYPECSAGGQEAGCLGLFWRHRSKGNIELYIGLLFYFPNSGKQFFEARGTESRCSWVH